MNANVIQIESLTTLLTKYGQLESMVGLAMQSTRRHEFIDEQTDFVDEMMRYETISND